MGLTDFRALDADGVQADRPFDHAALETLKNQIEEIAASVTHHWGTCYPFVDTEGDVTVAGSFGAGGPDWMCCYRELMIWRREWRTITAHIRGSIWLDSDGNRDVEVQVVFCPFASISGSGLVRNGQTTTLSGSAAFETYTVESLEYVLPEDTLGYIQVWVKSDQPATEARSQIGSYTEANIQDGGRTLVVSSFTPDSELEGLYDLVVMDVTGFDGYAGNVEDARLGRTSQMPVRIEINPEGDGNNYFYFADPFPIANDFDLYAYTQAMLIPQAFRFVPNGDLDITGKAFRSDITAPESTPKQPLGQQIIDAQRYLLERPRSLHIGAVAASYGGTYQGGVYDEYNYVAPVGYPQTVVTAIDEEFTLEHDVQIKGHLEHAALAVYAEFVVYEGFAQKKAYIEEIVDEVDLEVTVELLDPAAVVEDTATETHTFLTWSRERRSHGVNWTEAELQALAPYRKAVHIRLTSLPSDFTTVPYTLRVTATISSDARLNRHKGKAALIGLFVQSEVS